MANLVFFHAHPDDEAISTGGTMALAADAGHRVILVLATKGEVGDHNDGILAADETLAERREAELMVSAEILGVHAVEFLGYRDSGMVGEPTNGHPESFWQADRHAAGERLATILRRHQAEMLVGYDPNGVYGHPDHIQVHHVGHRGAEIAGVERVLWATANRTMIQQAVEDGAFEGDDGSDDERVDREQMGMPVEELTHAIDVMAALDRKRASLAAHASQIDEESFFLAMDDATFAMAFGTEWFVDASRYVQNPLRQGPLATSIFD